jgi:hypothetical protein
MVLLCQNGEREREREGDNLYFSVDGDGTPVKDARWWVANRQEGRGLPAVSERERG